MLPCYYLKKLQRDRHGQQKSRTCASCDARISLVICDKETGHTNSVSASNAGFFAPPYELTNSLAPAA